MNQRSKRRLEDGGSVAEHARRLRLRAGWNPSAVTAGPQERATAALEELRIYEELEAARECTACAEEREESGDPAALCREHIALAMGFGPRSAGSR